MTPKEKFTTKKPDVSHFRVFGCITYVHVPDKKRSKLDPKAEKCIFTKYSSDKKRSKLDPQAHKCIFIGYSSDKKDIDVLILPFRSCK